VPKFRTLFPKTFLTVTFYLVSSSVCETFLFSNTVFIYWKFHISRDYVPIVCVLGTLSRTLGGGGGGGERGGE